MIVAVAAALEAMIADVLLIVVVAAFVSAAAAFEPELMMTWQEVELRRGS